MSQPSDGHLEETPVSRTPVFAGRLLHVFDDTVRLPDGRTTRREVVEHPGAVAVVARDEAGRVVLVRQWRHPARRALWELPAGTRDQPGEALEATARRELAEETGVAASRWRSLGHAPLAPGYSSEEMHFFAAEGLERGSAHTDADELMDVEWFDRAQVARLVEAGQVDVKTVAGLALCGWSVAGGG